MKPAVSTHAEALAAPADRMAARQWRRARRVSLVAVIGFTFALWFAENYLRYDLNESQYIMSLTLPPESARAILRSVVKRETERLGQPVATHLEALASIEEDDLVLPRYQDAYTLNPISWELILNYGSRLFLNGRFADARERFREAGVQDANNALPRYLEAATLAISQQQESDLSEALAIIARANVSEAPLRFPQPLWHPSLPRRGELYQSKQTEIIDRACAPIYRFKNLVEARVRAEGAEDPYRWDDWLETVEKMGRRIVEQPVEGATADTSHAIAGIQTQLDMLALRVWLAETTNRPAPPGAEARAALLREALNRLNTHGQERDAAMEQTRSVLRQPLWNVASTAALLLLLVAGLSLLGRVSGLRHFGRELSPAFVGALPTLALVAFFSLLSAHSALAWAGAAVGWVAILTIAWHGLAFTGVVAGVLLAIAALPRKSEQVTSDAADAARHRRLRAGALLNLAQRNWEDLLAALLTSACAWFILGRIIIGLYPIQLGLLVPGFEAETVSLLADIVAMLNPANR